MRPSFAILLSMGAAGALTFALVTPPALHAQTQAPSAAPGKHGAGSASMHQAMMSGMESMKSMQPSGDIDKDFAAMMKAHHQQAVEMAKAEIAEGKSPELKAMARKIIKDQQKEIAQLDKWLASHK